MEEINLGKYKPQEILCIAESLGLNNSSSSGTEDPSLLDFIRKIKRGGVDSSLDDMSNGMITGTDTSSFTSD
jgi:hypothetical protein